MAVNPLGNFPRRRAWAHWNRDDLSPGDVVRIEFESPADLPCSWVLTTKGAATCAIKYGLGSHYHTHQELGTVAVTSTVADVQINPVRYLQFTIGGASGSAQLEILADGAMQVTVTS